jgi:hypothetical protein
MNEDEQILRAQLCTAYQVHRTNIDRLVPWSQARILALQGSEDAGLFGRSGEIEEMARHLLDSIADDQEIDLTSRLLGLSKVFARISDVSYYQAEDRVIVWPNRSPVPHEVRRPTTTLVLITPAIDAWIKYLSDVAPNPDGLIPEARSFLKAMLDLGLQGGKRQDQEVIWSRVGEIDQLIAGKASRAAALKLLKDRQLVNTKSGTGTTLTDNGLKLAESLK